MDNTSIKAGTPPAKSLANAVQATPPAPRAESPRDKLPEGFKKMLFDFLRPIASLRLTVVLFVLSMILVFYGTLAQVDLGIWTVVSRYFRSFIVWIPFRVLAFNNVETAHYPFSLPFPGGWLLGGLLLVNLISAHIIKFKMTWRRSGILLIHAGLIVMMLSELNTGLFALEGHMRIEEHQSSNYIEHSNYPEIAVVLPVSEKKDDVVVVPTRFLATGKTIQDSKLPFDVVIEEYMVNSVLHDLKPGEKSKATAGIGLELAAEAREEGSGVDTDSRIDAASAYVTIKKGGQTLGTYLLSIHLIEPQWINVDGTNYQVSLRFKRSYKPYTIHLQKFTHDFYPNTTKPKDFKSEIRFVYPERNEDREEQIYMNHPFRLGDEAETFYQAGTIPDQTGKSIGTILQVVHNPTWILPGWMLQAGWSWPLISCVMVSFGMLIHFGITLVRFIERSTAL